MFPFSTKEKDSQKRYAEHYEKGLKDQTTLLNLNTIWGCRQPRYEIRPTNGEQHRKYA